MKVILAGGSGQIGRALAQAYRSRNWEVVTLGRSVELAAPCEGESYRIWDGASLDSWQEELDGANWVVNLAGRTVNCRYTSENMRQMMNSRVDSVRVIGQAIAACSKPPSMWFQMSTATIYAHRFDVANDEEQGVIGGQEPGVPAYWARSVEIAKAWERTLEESPTPNTRKVALRAAMVMDHSKGGIFDTLHQLVRRGLGGSIGGGRQYISWIHQNDFMRALDYIEKEARLDGAINLCSPNPLTQAEFMRVLREASGVGIGLPATAWMAKLGAVFMRTDAELVLKSRRVVPKRLLDAGFEFEFPRWNEACRQILQSPRRGEMSP